MERPFNWLKNNKDKIEYKAETTIFIVFVNFTNMIFSEESRRSRILEGF